jgi:flavodoxin
MKTLILYYSYSGKTKVLAEKLATKKNAKIVELKDVKRPGKLKAYTAGIVASIRGKAWKIQALDVDLAKCDKIILLAPVWAGNPPPAVNGLLELMPEGKSVSIKMVSMSGKSDCKERMKQRIKDKNCTLDSFEDIKT